MHSARNDDQEQPRHAEPGSADRNFGRGQRRHRDQDATDDEAGHGGGAGQAATFAYRESHRDRREAGEREQRHRDDLERAAPHQQLGTEHEGEGHQVLGHAERGREPARRPVVALGDGRGGVGGERHRRGDHGRERGIEDEQVGVEQLHPELHDGVADEQRHHHVGHAGGDAEPEHHAGDERAHQQQGQVARRPADHQGGQLGAKPGEQDRTGDEPQREAGDGHVHQLPAAVVEHVHHLPRSEAVLAEHARCDADHHRDEHRVLKRSALREQVDERAQREYEGERAHALKRLTHLRSLPVEEGNVHPPGRLQATHPEPDREPEGEEVHQRRDQRRDHDVHVSDIEEHDHEEDRESHDRRHDLGPVGGGRLDRGRELRLQPHPLHERDGHVAGHVDIAHRAARHRAHHRARHHRHQRGSGATAAEEGAGEVHDEVQGAGVLEHLAEDQEERHVLQARVHGEAHDPVLVDVEKGEDAVEAVAPVPREPHRKVLAEQRVDEEHPHHCGEAYPQASDRRDHHHVDPDHSQHDIGRAGNPLAEQQLLPEEDQVPEDQDPEDDVEAVERERPRGTRRHRHEVGGDREQPEYRALLQRNGGEPDVVEGEERQGEEERALCPIARALGAGREPGAARRLRLQGRVLGLSPHFPPSS